MAETAGDAHGLVAAGRARLAAGDAVHALALLRSACAALPDSGEAHFLLGAALHRLNQLPAALAAFERALVLAPGSLQSAHASLAVLCEMGRSTEARTRVEELLRAHPNDPQLQYNAALVQESLGDLARAVEHYDHALALAPEAFEVLLNRGVVLTRLDRLSEALANNQQLAALHPERVESHFNLAEASLAASRYADAAAHAARALALDPRHAGAMLDLGLALAALGRLAEGQEILTKAKALGASLPPGAPVSTSKSFEFNAGEVFITRAYERLEEIDWSEHQGLRERFEALIDDERFGAMASPALSFRAMMLGIGLPHQSRLAARVGRGWVAAPRPLLAPARASPGRIRIGYVSSDFRDHPMGHVIAPLLERHDHRRCELFAYALAGDESEYRRRIRNASDRFVDVSAHSSEEIARAIRADGVDVLVNLNGYTTGHRSEVFAMRPAPVQASYFGYPATMGAPFIDYLIADCRVVPESDHQWYSEAIAWLPKCYFAADAAEPVPAAPARSAAGLPAEGVVFCDFNQHVKITPEVFAIWMRVLGRVAGSVLWLLSGRGDANLRGHAEAAGIDPRRLVFAPRLPRSAHLARLQLADLFLDTLPCNAHTTAADALRAGVPVLTCPGATFAGRVAASLAHAAGLHELVVSDLGEYEALAVALAAAPDRLRALKRHLISGLGTLPVFDVAGRASALEDLYAAMVDRRRRGLPPGAIGAATRA